MQSQYNSLKTLSDWVLKEPPLQAPNEDIVHSELNAPGRAVEDLNGIRILYRNMIMAKGKNVLTTGDVAKICNVAPRTVSKWFDSGQLKGYRIPGSKDRRIPLNELVRFMKAHNMPTGALSVGKLRVLIVDDQIHEKEDLIETLASRGNYEVQTACTSFEAGAAIQAFAPHAVVINLLAHGIDANGICRSIRGSEEFETIKIIALANQLNDQEALALMQRGFDGHVSDPSDAHEIIQKIEDATAIIY